MRRRPRGCQLAYSSAFRSVSSIHAATALGFPHGDACPGQVGGQPVPDPDREHLTRRIVEALDIVEAVMIELPMQPSECVIDVGVVEDPAMFGSIGPRTSIRT